MRRAWLWALVLVVGSIPASMASGSAAGEADGTSAPDSLMLDPPSPGLGATAVLRLAAAPEDSSQVPVGVGVLVRPGKEVGTYVVIPVRVGKVGIALPSTRAVADTLWWDVPRSIEQANPDLLRPIQSVGPLGPNWWPTALVLAALFLPPLVWLWRRTGRRSRSAPAFPIPVEPPHVVALRRLEEVARAGWLDRREFDRYYVEASRALRAYIGGRYRVPVLDWTSREVVDGLKDAGYERETVALVGPLLEEADEVKFAAGQPSHHAAQQWLERARQWILDTRVEPRYSTAESLAAAESLDTGGRR